MALTLAGSERDPYLGTFRGPLSWLQTAEETELELTLMPEQDEVSMRCGGASVSGAYRLETSDDVLRFSSSWSALAGSDGFLRSPLLDYSVDATSLLAAGKIPEAPDIASRNPTALLRLSPEDEGVYSATILIYTRSDRLHVALGTLTREPTL